MTAPTATNGPVDEKAGLRAKLYAVLTALLGIPAVAQLFGVLTSDQATNVNQILTGVIGLVGAGGFALATSKTNTQVKNGTFDAAPNGPVLSVFEQLQAIKDRTDATLADTVNAVQTASATIQNATAVIPGGGYLSAVVGQGSQAVEDLIAAVGGVNRK